MASADDVRGHVLALMQVFLGGDPATLKAAESELEALGAAPGTHRSRQCMFDVGL
jgi:hypothetical protein